MIRRVLILFILVSNAVTDSCVRYTFEQNFNEWLTNEWGGACVAMPSWVVGTYSDLDLTGQNERSTSFIVPLPEMSCVSSFIFPMNVGGTIEVNIYMGSTEPSDQIIVLAYQLDITGDRVIGQAVNIAMDPTNFVSGWHTLTMILTGSETYEGYISIMGMASPDSIVLVDSFRYIPPDMDESECQLYEEITTPEPATIPTPVPPTIPTTDPPTIPTTDPPTIPTTDPPTIPTTDPPTIPTTDPTTIPTQDPPTNPITYPNTVPTPDPTTIPTPDATTISTPDATTIPTPDPTTIRPDSDDTDSPTPYPCPTPPIENEDSKGFWTPLTITMLALLYLIVFVLICLLFYEIGRRRAKAGIVANDFDFESLPSSFKVPRVKTVYPDANTNPYARRNSW